MSIKIRIVSDFDKRGLTEAEKALGGLSKAAGIALAAVGAAVAGIAVKSVQEFSKFDAALTQSKAIMGDLTQAMEKDMADAAREVAKVTTFSAEQAAESFFFLASAGLDAAASIEAMPKVAKFAQAGMFDMALATDLLTDAQSALGLTIRDDAIKNMENLVRVSDVLVKANTLANASVEQFSTALTTKAGAALRALGKDVEEGVAVLAAFADQGIKGEIAGTQLSIVLRDLTTKAIKNKSAFREMGIAVFDANGEMNNLGDIIGNLETALAGMSDETQKATLLQLGFSDKSLASLQALLGTSEAIKTYEGALREAAGTTDEIASKQLETLNAQLGLIKSAFVDLGIEIGERLEPTVTGLAEEVQLLLAEMVASPEFEAFIVELTVAMEELLPSLIELLPPLTELAVELVPLLIDLIPVLAWVTDFFRVIVEGLTGGIARLDEELGLVFGTAENGVGIVDSIRNAFQRFDDAARNLANRIRSAWQDLNTFLEFAATGGGRFKLEFPGLAEGGIGTRPTLAMIGEGGESEAVIPLSKMSQFGFGAGGGRGGAGSNITINVNAGMGTDGARVGEAVVKAIRSYERTSGRVFASA